MNAITVKRGLLILFASSLVAASPGPDKPIKSDKSLLQGKWKLIACEDEGKKSRLTDEELQLIKLTVKDDRYIIDSPPVDGVGTKVATRQELKFVLDESKDPKTIDLTVMSKNDQGRRLLGIYSLKDDHFRLCFCEDGKTRPAEFTTKAGSGCILGVYEREKR